MTEDDETRDCLEGAPWDTSPPPPMSAFVPIPLGQPIPNLPHAVSCSLPTMRSVRGYEEKDPEITRHMGSGYPRFVLHPFVGQLSAHYQSASQMVGQILWLTSSARMAEELAAVLRAKGTDSTPFAADGIHGLAHADDPAIHARAKLHLQNVGGFLASRAAEDRLAQLGLIPAVAPEALYVGDALTEVRRHLQPLFGDTVPEDLLLATGGMNAVSVAFRVVSDRQAARGRTIWVQLGWLYLDTIALLKRFTATPEDYIYLPDVFDHSALETLFATHGNRIAGLVIEAPTNPLIQTADLETIADLARSSGATIIADSSVSSPFDVDVLPYADVVAVSLTKYTASEGDLLAGLVVVNPATPDAATLRREIKARLEPIYSRDLARLAHQIGDTRDVLAQIHSSVPLIAAWLEAHPAVDEVYWTLHPKSRVHYEKIARAPDAVGCMISFTLHRPLEEFYDRLRLPKGPSFGMKTTLICPFMYLAHYHLVSTEAGRAELRASGINPDLLRFSVGCEPTQDIITALDEALR